MARYGLLARLLLSCCLGVAGVVAQALSDSRYAGQDQVPDGDLICAFKNGSTPGFAGVHLQDPVPAEDVFIDIEGNLRVTKCNYCYTLWADIEISSESGLSEQHILSQGCWLTHDGCSDGPECVMRDAPGAALSNIQLGAAGGKPGFCCCRGNLCNRDVSIQPGLASPTEAEHAGSIENSEFQLSEALSYSKGLLTALVAVISGLAVVTISLSLMLFRLYRSRLRRAKLLLPADLHHHHHHHRPEAAFDKKLLRIDPEAARAATGSAMTSPLLPAMHYGMLADLGTLRFGEIVLSEGRFGPIYRGTVGSSGGVKHDVAVKVFSRTNADSFANERSIYEMRQCNNEAASNGLCEYLGAMDTCSVAGTLYENVLVLSYAEHGSLAMFLKCHTVSWSQLVRMLEAIGRGLAHLHFEGSARDKHRTTICHRDVNPHNILVKSDLSCCLADFSSAARIVPGSSSATAGVVGTPRYMAPELLEACVNLRDCETALKQVDVYALGLTFWETARRCKDLYQGSEVPCYASAFAAELSGVSSCPSVDQMRQLVARNRARPLFPPVWKDSNPALQLLKETIEYCWDQDGEARLTALCVVERMRELQPLWDRYHRHHGAPTTAAGGAGPPAPAHASNGNNKGQKTKRKVEAARPGSEGIVFHNNDISVSRSQCTAAARSDPVSAPPPAAPLKLANVLSKQQAAPRLQPHQGSNPCQERNLMPRSASSLLVLSSKDEESQRCLAEARRLNGERQRALEESGLLTLAGDDGPRLHHAAAPPPIPYVQNDLRAAPQAPPADASQPREEKNVRIEKEKKQNRRR